VKVFDAEDAVGITVDPCKLVISATDGGMTGQELYDILRERYHLQMEMATDEYVLAIVTLMDEPDGWDRLAKALLGIEQKLVTGTNNQDKEAKRDSKPIENEVVMTIAQAYDREWEKMEVAQCVGRVAAEFVNLYPPGIPWVVPGERLSRELIEKLEYNRRLGLNVQGAEDGYIKVIRL
jgi:arginine/lysine/ornithine decarboxylase